MSERDRGAETLHALARAAYDSEQARYDAAEAKAARYLTVLALLLGAAAIGVDDLIRTLRETQVAWTWRLSFSGVYLVTFVTAFVAGILALRAMNVGKVPALPLDDQLRALFRDHGYSDALSAMSDAFFAEAGELRALNESRGNYLRQVSRLLMVTLFSASISVLLYIPLRVSAPDAGTPAALSTQPTTMTQPANSPNTQPAPAPSGSPAPQPQPPKFDHVTKGDTSPHETTTKK